MYKAIAHNAILGRYFPWIAAVLVVVLTIAIYAAGLHGPFLLDDIGNLDPLKRWVDGHLTWRGVVMDNRSGPGGRPLSMLTFLGNAWVDPTLNAFTFKAVNLGIHLACGAIAWRLVTLVFECVGIGRRLAPWLAAFVATMWLWLPMQVSTVLYVVQRMAQLSTMLTFATLALYLSLRLRMRHGSLIATGALWIAVPLLALAAGFAKETGLLALPLAAALEYTILDRRHRPRQINVFFVLTVCLPAFVAALYVATHPQWITSGYTIRDFTLPQRLMTEPRVIWSYAQTTFFPVGSRMGLFHDTYPVSTSIWSPPSTAISLLAWLAAISAAIASRHLAPLFTFGVFAYLISHALEAGPISLELYFDHRNYGAALFALIAVIGLFRLALGKSAEKPHVRRALLACGGAALVIYGVGTWSQVSGWRDAPTFYAVQYGYNPDSPRLLSNLAGRAMAAKDLDGALRYIDMSERHSPKAELPTATLWRLLAYCAADVSVAPASLYDQLAARTGGRITTYTMVAWETLTNRLVEGCEHVDAPRVANIIQEWLDTSDEDAGAQATWRTRYNTGRVLAESGRIGEARALVLRAWRDSGRNNGIGVLLFQLDASLGDTAGCREVLASLSRAEDGPDRRLTTAIKAFRQALQNGEIGGDPK